MKITWYFISNSGSKLAYARAVTTELIVDEKEELKTSMDSNENYKTGIIDWAKSNKKFLEIIDQHAINDLSNQEIICKFEASLTIQSIPIFYLIDLVKKTNSQEIQIIFEYYYQNKHAKDIQRGHSIDAQFLSRIIKKFHRNLKIRKIQNRKFLNKKKLLTLDHVEKLGSFSKNSVGIPLYISDLSKCL